MEELPSDHLPDGVRLLRTPTHRDARGDFTEIFRAEWPGGVHPVQWNCVRTRKGVLRGMRLHPVHDDWFILLSGRAAMGLSDIRPGALPGRKAGVVLLEEHDRTALVIPHGVAHGFLALESSLVAYGASHYFSAEDELGCRWDDPGLGITWPRRPSLLSPQDRNGISLTELLSKLERRAPAG